MLTRGTCGCGKSWALSTFQELPVLKVTFRLLFRFSTHFMIYILLYISVPQHLFSGAAIHSLSALLYLSDYCEYGCFGSFDGVLFLCSNSQRHY
ncbi:hypothetical protein BRL48_gp32 [Bat mastadenovirus G]|uniref:Uncharacterized protein n=1 Tax=Bat mastadenovirus G TaxID=2015376 RepID=A0A1J0FAS1_9ADEN|nr:hypothetical protein BRL48_gp32 [Bat mastadenovirus G]APC26084.1 hypothetical protein [Bat mastadenovirus G]